MKIIILVRILWASGAQKIAIEEAKSLTKLGHEVKLVFLRETESGKYLKPMLEGINFEVYSSKKPKWIYSAVTGMFMPDRKGNGTVDYNLLKQYPKSINKNDVDYIICHDPWTGLAGYRINKRLDIPYSVMYHEKVTGKYSVPILGKFALKIEKKILKNAAAVFGITKKVTDTVHNAYNIEVIPNLPGMNLGIWKPFNEKKNILLVSATFDKNRDPIDYVNIIEKLPDFMLYVVGSWRETLEYDKFIKLVNDKDVASKVVVKRGISETELQSLYTDAKFSLRFGKDEYGLGTSNVEAISKLTPIIINSDLGISDLIREYGGGIIIDSKDPEIAKSIIQKYNNKSSYETLQKQLINITKTYTWEFHANNLIRAIRSN